MAYVVRGVSGYQHTGNWSWEFFPPPYQFLGPKNPAPMPAPVLKPSGLGCACGCNSCGLGLFESGFDISQWGVGEWAAVAGIAYLTASIIGDVGRGASRVRKTYRKRSSRSRKKKALQEELAGL